MTVKLALCWFGAAAVAQLVLSRVLDSISLIEGLLSPSAASSALLVPLAVVFYAARLFAWFIAPGLVLGALVVSFRLGGSDRTN